MEETSKSVQDTFLNHIRTNKTEVTVFLINGVKLQGIVTSFDNFSLFSGSDSLALKVCQHGGAGAITATSNISGKLLSFLINNYKKYFNFVIKLTKFNVWLTVNGPKFNIKKIN